ncbi:MAG: peptide chain release factor N(5)-glutamine methyltransferase [Candidatus Dormibacteria bacterium]
MAEKVMELIAKAAPYLAKHGSGSPRLDAELLLAEALGVSRMDLYLQFERPLTETEVNDFRTLCRRRAGGEPIAYIRRRREFMSVDLLVTPAVLIPRPETEILVEEALRLSRPPVGPPAPARFLDVGTGSGAIAVAMAVHHTACRVVATDISAGAVEVARRNVERLELQDRVEVREADLAAGVEGPFDLVLANLPYIDPSWPDAVTPEVRATEPAGALFAGEDGLDLVRRLLADLPRLLRSGGSALLEVDPRNADKAAALGRAAGEVRVLHDLAGHPRVVAVAR